MCEVYIGLVGWLVGFACWWWVVLSTMVKRLSEKLSVLQQTEKTKYGFFRYRKTSGRIETSKENTFVWNAWELWTIIAKTSEKVIIFFGFDCVTSFEDQSGQARNFYQ